MSKSKSRAVALIAAIVMAITSTSVTAGLLDPWYLVYRVEGGQIQHMIGPFQTKAECELARIMLPLGTRFVECFQ